MRSTPLSKKALIKGVDRLRELAEGERPNNWSKGLSADLYTHIQCLAFQKILYVACQEWNKFSGDPLYPVPHPHFGPMSGYKKTYNKWKDGYGENRRMLAKFCASWIEEKYLK